MDYEKKYKEALLKARAAKQNTESSVTIGILEEIFPELKESEDEKIRKEIIQTLKKFAKCVEDGHDAPEAKDFLVKDTEKKIAWLEKQGEPTEINPSEFDLRLNKLLKQFESLPKEELITNLSYYLNVIQNDGTYKIEKQGEQKLAWSEEDEVKINRIVACLENLNVADNDILLKDIDWLNSLKERIGG